MQQKLYLSGFPKALVAPDHADLDAVVTKTIIGPDAPDVAPIVATSKIASVGSCFAQEVSDALRTKGLDVLYLFMSERWNSAFALDAFFARTLEDVPFPSGFLNNAEEWVEQSKEAAAHFRQADLFILTFGLSLCWFNSAGHLILEPGDTHTDKGMIRSLKNFRMVQTSVEQNEVAIVNCINRIKKFRPEASIVVTLSPVPMLAALSGTTAIQASTVSKAVLRLAIENVRRRFPDVHYWPSYEIVNWYGAHVDRAFGDDDRDARHVRRSVIDLITRLFIKNYVKT